MSLPTRRYRLKMKHDHHSIKSPCVAQECDMTIEQWLINKRKAIREQQYFESPSDDPPVAVAERGSTPLQVSHNEDRIELESKTRKTQSSLSKVEKPLTRSFNVDLENASPPALNEYDLCDLATTTVAAESMGTVSTEVITRTSSTVHQQAEPEQLEPTTMILSVTRADAAAIDADVERAISSVLCRRQQEQGADLIEASIIADESMYVRVKQIADLKSWKLLRSVICLVLTAIIGGGVIAVTRMMSKNTVSESIDSNSATASPLGNDNNENVSSLPFWTQDPMNTTIDKYLTQFSELSVTSVEFHFETTQIYLKILSQPDSQLTVVPFPIHKLPGALSYSVLERFANPVWNGHVVSKVELWASCRLLVCQAFASTVSCESHNMISTFWSSSTTLLLSHFMSVNQVDNFLKQNY